MASSDKSHIELLDVLRGVAVLAVIGVHVGGGATTITGEPTKWTALTDYGRCGVELFFVISGVLMARLYVDNTNWSVKDYYLRRVGRLMPLWVLFSSVSWFGWNWIHTQIGAGPDLSGNNQLGLTLLSIPFLGWLSPIARDWIPVGGWSVQAEVGHYLLFPLIRKRIGMCVNILLGLQLTEYLLHKFPSVWADGWLKLLAEGWLRLSLASTLMYFAIGFYIVVLPKMKSKDLPIPPSVAFKLILAVCFSAWIPFFAGNNINAFAFILVATLMSYCAAQISLLKWILLRAGKYSYFMYFAHFWIILLFQVIAQNHIAHWPLATNQTYAVMYATVVAISALLGSISWKYFEQPFVRATRGKARD